MTNREAIEIVNNLIILNKSEFYPDELEAIKILIQAAKFCENMSETLNKQIEVNYDERRV